MVTRRKAKEPGAPGLGGGEGRAPVASPGDARARAAAPAVVVAFLGPEGTKSELRFAAGFRIGRGDECAVRVDSPDISRAHAEVFWEDGTWWVRDLGSKNGTFLGGARIEREQLAGRAVVRLGVDGPELTLSFEDAGRKLSDTTIAGRPKTVSFYVQRYLEGTHSKDHGERTLMIRRAFRQVMSQRRRRYLAAIAVISLLFLGAGAVSLYQNAVLQRQKRLAEEIFYNMKAMELQLAQLEARVGAAGDETARHDLEAGRAKLVSLVHSYDKFLQELDIYSDKVSEEQRLILRVARVFGECEVAMPEYLVDEVDRFIKKWRDDGDRLAEGISRASTNGYVKAVVPAMLENHLPPQFFYVALQESDFRLDVCGPETRWGIAKGPWQLIPSTAIAYGLKTGPLYLVRQPDPRDERHNFAKSTRAAAKYLRDIYNQEAQASGLLVIASYNWGEGGVRQLIASMPENPKDRNFWRLLVDHRKQFPRQTYQYVFRIFAAAVIGENPRLFGFKFDSPLAGAVASVGR